MSTFVKGKYFTIPLTDDINLKAKIEIENYWNEGWEDRENMFYVSDYELSSKKTSSDMSALLSVANEGISICMEENDEQVDSFDAVLEKQKIVKDFMKQLRKAVKEFDTICKKHGNEFEDNTIYAIYDKYDN